MTARTSRTSRPLAASAGACALAPGAAAPALAAPAADGDDTVAIGPADLDPKEGAGHVVYAWDSAADKNLAPATQTLGGMESVPNGVGAGGSGAAVAPNSSDQWVAWAAAAGTAAPAGVLVARRAAGRRG